MGRKPTRWANLPKGMRARERGKLIHYYFDTGGKPRRELPLGSDYVLAVQRWADLAKRAKPEAALGTFAAVADAYKREVLPGKAPRTRNDNEKELEWLLKFFNTPPAPLDKIEPKHISQYLQWRVSEAVKLAEAQNAERLKAGRKIVPIPPKWGQVRANRDKALFSHIWNFARSSGFTRLANPCTGVRGFSEQGRDVMVDDELLGRVMARAGTPLQFALRLAHLTGQRPADVLRMSEAHIAGGVLHVRQGKTKTKLRMVIEGELEALLTEIRAFKADLQSLSPALLVNETGQKLTTAMLRGRFDDARALASIKSGEFQFRDLRAKAATEADEGGGTRQAQGLLGHTTEAMTANYIRHKVGKKVKPLR
jgi:integrase